MPYERSNKSIQDSAFKLRSGNRATYSDLQKESPVKVLPIIAGIAKVAAAIAKGAAVAGKAVGTAAKVAKTVGGKALTFAKNNPELSSTIVSGLMPKDKAGKGVKPIIEGEQQKIV